MLKEEEMHHSTCDFVHKEIPQVFLQLIIPMNVLQYVFGRSMVLLEATDKWFLIYLLHEVHNIQGPTTFTRALGN